MVLWVKNTEEANKRQEKRKERKKGVKGSDDVDADEDDDSYDDELTTTTTTTMMEGTIKGIVLMIIRPREGEAISSMDARKDIFRE